MRVPEWRQALGHLSDRLPAHRASPPAEPMERVAPDALAARIGARRAATPSPKSDGSAPWRRALRDR